jgi:hypothetical protein
LGEKGQQEVARELVLAQLHLFTDADARASAIILLATLYADTNGKPSYRSFALRELAANLRPNDTTILFDLAYAYSEAGAEKMALLTYERLVARDSKTGTGLNNMGVSAARLSLPFTSIEYYRKAEAQGEPLAMANLAWKFIEAGFASEASALIKKARREEAVHPNLDKAAGDLVSRAESEEESLKKFRLEAGSAKMERVKYASALITPLDWPALSGTYSGMPSDLLLTVESDGNAVGSFVAGGKQAMLTGKFLGSVLDFSWQTADEPVTAPLGSSLLGIMKGGTQRRMGTGLLIFDAGGPGGYWTDAAMDLDPPDRAQLVVWTLLGRPA